LYTDICRYGSVSVDTYTPYTTHVYPNISICLSVCLCLSATSTCLPVFRHAYTCTQAHLQHYASNVQHCSTYATHPTCSTFAMHPTCSTHLSIGLHTWTHICILANMHVYSMCTWRMPKDAKGEACTPAITHTHTHTHTHTL
jgi:hypothetical protein